MATIQKYNTSKQVPRYRVMWRINGKQKSKSFDRWKAANDYKIYLENSFRNGSYVQSLTLTIKEYLNEWFPLHSQNLAYNTITSYKYIIDLYIIPHIGNISLQKINANDIDVLCKKLLKTKSNRTAQYTYTILNTAMKSAVSKRYITFNPCDTIKKPKSNPITKPKALQPDKIKFYINAFDGTWMYIAVVLGVFTGMRRGELAALRWKDINFKEKTISINGSIYMDENKRVRKSTKNGKTRIVYMQDSLIQLLKEHRKKQKRNQIYLGVLYIKSDYVVTEDNGICPRPDYMRKFFNRKLKSKGLSHIRVQDLRHTSGSLKLYEGADIQTVADDLGHHSAAFTAKTYIHTIEEGKKRAADSMEKYLKQSL